MRTADIYVLGKLAGALTENDDGKFSFLYDEQYLNDSSAVAVSCTMPLRSEAYVSDALFPFFDGLIPEGWLLDIAEKNWKLDGRDRMGLLLALPPKLRAADGQKGRRHLSFRTRTRR